MSNTTKNSDYIGHKKEDGQTQSLIEHLQGTAKLSEKYASQFHAASWGKTIGMLHDIGKYSQEFQERILYQTRKVDHSTAGAQEINKLSPYGKIAAFCIAGHHSGLPNGGSFLDAEQDKTLFGRLKRKDIPKYDSYKDEVKIELLQQPPIRVLQNKNFSIAFFIRMLYSCLVDADFLDTEAFMTDGEIERGNYDSLQILKEKLDKHISEWWEAKNEINEKRCEILRDCIEAGKREKGIFTLTVPTGGGKTVSSLAFALNHALLKNKPMNRVIYVIPYTSIIEQTAQIFRDIFGEENVLEHHSNIAYEDEDESSSNKSKLKFSTENWDAPIIVTTNVQFFESFFSNKSSKCRKLHNVANSILIFDEAQMIPNFYLIPCIHVISELVSSYECSAVLCTATQPSLPKLITTINSDITYKEICKDVKNLYSFFKRNRFETLGNISSSDLVRNLMNHDQALCIVNTRKLAQELYQQLYGEGVFHLSTLMYPIHRKRVLDEIRNRLKLNLPCKVVATSLIEAGVDVDFPSVYREKAGLDSEIQAAGRCNREGTHSYNSSIVYIFSSEEAEQHSPYSLRQPLEVTSMVEDKFSDISSPEAITYYFDKLHQIKGDTLDKKLIIESFEKGIDGNIMPFEEIAKLFHLIEQDTKSVFIPCPSEPAAIQLEKRLRNGERTRKLLRTIAQFSVNIFEDHFKELQNLGRIDVLDESVVILNDLDSYRMDMGLQLVADEGRGVFV